MSITEPNYGQRFDGSDYTPAVDDARLTGQLHAVFNTMKDGKWRTLLDIKQETGITLDASVSKQLRHLRYERFGAYLVEKRRSGHQDQGLWEYRLGKKGEGIPAHRACKQCQTLKAQLKELCGCP